jgi:hypothetical protein
VVPADLVQHHHPQHPLYCCWALLHRLHQHLCQLQCQLAVSCWP